MIWCESLIAHINQPSVSLSDLFFPSSFLRAFSRLLLFSAYYGSESFVDVCVCPSLCVCPRFHLLEDQYEF